MITRPDRPRAPTRRIGGRRRGPEPAPPDPAPPEPDAAPTLARIESIAQTARATWFTLLGYLAFVLVTLFSVEHVNFFSVEAATQLPLVNIAIPTTAFFWAAPWLGAALHVYLQLYLLKLWDELAAASARIHGAPLGDRAFPWLVIDWALRRRPDSKEATTHRPMGWLADLVALALVWLAAPAVLLGLWWRSMPAHEEGMTLFIALPLLASLYASWKGWRHARRRLAAPGVAAPEETRRASRRRRAAFVALALLLAAISWARTEGGVDFYANRLIDAWEAQAGPVFEAGPRGYEIDAQEVQERWVAEQWWIPALDDLSVRDEDGRLVWTPLAPINLVDADLARRPADWVSRETAERRFRVEWCRDRGLPLAACERLRRDDFSEKAGFGAAQAAQAAAQDAWCGKDGRNFEGDACRARFSDFNRAFGREWSEQREEYLANLAKPRMSGRDLRGANAPGAFLAGLDLSRARMEGAVLSRARMEGAVLIEARLQSAGT